MKIFCVIPAYNENGNLIPLYRGLKKILPKISTEFKILFVVQGEDGSKDTLAKINDKHLEFVYFKNPLGIGKAYVTGFQKVSKKFSHVLTMDADLNHDPAMIPKFIKEMNKTHADLIIGSRFISGGQFSDRRIWKRIISRITNLIITKVTRLDVHDITSGYRLIKREVINRVSPKLNERGYPNYMELIIRAKNEGFKISEVPISYRPRVWGESKMRKVQTFFNYASFFSSEFLFPKNPD